MMLTRLLSRGSRTWALLAASSLMPAMTSLAQDVKRVEPSPAAIAVPDLSAIGKAHSVVVRDGTLYVGATGGLAAIDAQGKVLWTLTLPAASARSIDADAEHVAYTSYAVKGLERGTGVTAALMWGSPSDRLEVDSADAGLVTKEGKTLWSAKFDEPSALSPPSLGKTTVAVMTAKTVRLLDLGTGSKIGDVSMFTNYLGISANHVSRVNVTRPASLADEFFAVHQVWFKKLNPQGKELVATRLDGLFLTAGPVLCKEQVILGAEANLVGTIFTGKKARVYAASAKGEAVWKATVDDEVSGVADLACNDDLIFAAANAHISAFTPAGKNVWQVNSKGGSLFPGTHRGIVRAGKFPVARQVSAGRQMLLAGPYLYITTRAKADVASKEDVLTVLDAKTGDIVEGIDLHAPIIDMTVFGSQLAVATGEGLKLIALKP